LRRRDQNPVSPDPGFFRTASPAARKRQIIIAGGGIAGLTAALALEQRGFAVTVFERTASMPEDGAGVQLSPNATRLLGKLGVMPALAENAAEVRQVGLVSGALKPLLTLDVSDARERWGAPYLAVHRADLAAALLRRAQARPAISIRFGAEVTNFAAHSNGVTASVTAAGKIAEHEGIFLIGADGVWSKVRREISGQEPVRSGYLAHRRMIGAGALLPAFLRQRLENQEVAAFLSPGAHLVAYPLRQGAMMNLVLITKAEPPALRRETGDGAQQLTSAEIRHFGPQIRSFLDSGGEWTQWPIITCPHAAKWSDGKSAMLIGDAAHAMTPFGAQGAAMAIEDAWTLAACMDAHRDNFHLAAAAYEELRRARIRRVAMRSNLNRQAYHARGPVAFARDALFRFKGQSMLDGLDWLYGFDASAKVL
jgi:salicylate hydroxylase